MTREEQEMRVLVRESDVIDRTDGSALAKAFNHLWEKYIEQEPCEDAVSREAVRNIVNDIRDCISVEGYWAILERLKKLPSVKPQEPSITWVTGADGAKIAFWDVPVWKVTKICEILGEPQESEEQE